MGISRIMGISMLFSWEFPCLVLLVCAFFNYDTQKIQAMHRAFHSAREIVGRVECHFVTWFSKFNPVSPSAISTLFLFAIKFNKKMADIFYNDHDMYNFY